MLHACWKQPSRKHVSELLKVSKAGLLTLLVIKNNNPPKIKKLPRDKKLYHSSNFFSLSTSLSVPPPLLKEASVV